MANRDTFERFKALHQDGTFVLPNPHDIGAARLLEAAGFSAMATTSAGLAMALGRRDSTVSRDELVAHVASLAAVSTVPLNVDSEDCYPDEPGGITRTIEMLADAGAAGCSIEDWDPVAQHIVPFDLAIDRVSEAVAAADRVGMVLTARSEGVLRRLASFDETLERLQRFANLGAGCVYGPGITSAEEISRAVTDAGAPLNVLLMTGGLTVAELEGLGVRRISTGSHLSRAAYGAFTQTALTLLAGGGVPADMPGIPKDIDQQAFG